MARTEMADSAPAADRQSLQLKIGGMSCSFCSSSIERALGRQKGVDEVHVSLAHEEALIRYRAEDIDETRIKDTLRALGYTIRDPRKVQAFEEQEALARMERRDLASAALFAVVLVTAMAGMWLDLWPPQPWFRGVAWAIATYVFAWNGRRILHKAWGAAWRGIANQHVLLAVAAIGAYIGGVPGTPVPWLGWPGLAGFPAVDFFAVVVFLTAYHLLSGVVSLHVRAKAPESVRKLLDMQPPTARMVRHGREEEVAIESSDVIVMGERVGAIMEARAIGAVSYRKTVQNLWLAFVFNGLGVPLAASGLVHPSWAMLAMAASVSAVLANSFGGRFVTRRGAPPPESTAATGEAKDASTARTERVVAVPTIHCQGCVDTIRAYLLTEDGVDAVAGDPKARTIRVSYRPDRVAPEAIETAIKRLGHKIETA